MKKRRQAKKKQRRQNILASSKAQTGVHKDASTRPQPTASNFNSTAYVINALAKTFLAIGVAVGINDASNIAPALSTISHYWLTATEFVWRQPAELVGQPFFSEIAAAMTCYVALMGIAFSALWLEEKNSPLPRPLSEKHKAALRDDWHSRVVQSILSSSIATLVLVASVEYFAFQRVPNIFFGSVPWWYWTMHAMAAGIVPLVIWKAGFRQLLCLVAIGMLCGALFFAISLPSAIDATKKGLDAQIFYRTLFLKYAIVRFPFSIALVMAIPSARFLLAQLLAVSGIVTLIVGIGWLVTRT